MPYFLWVLATVETDAGRLEFAEAAAGECLRLARELGAPMMLLCGLDAAAACARCAGDDETAIALLSRPSRSPRGGRCHGRMRARHCIAGTSAGRSRRGDGRWTAMERLLPISEEQCGSSHTPPEM